MGAKHTTLVGTIAGRSPRVFPVISCSRRTDVPSFFMDWVLARIREGFVDVLNPFNNKQVTRVSLDPNDARVWVWWSKDFGPWLRALEKSPEIFERYAGHYFQFTINTPSPVERGIRASLTERLNQARALSERFSPQAVMWRFDPIVYWKKTNSDEIQNNLGGFDTILNAIADIGIMEMTFSFATPYPKVVRRMKRRGKILIDPSLEEKICVVEELRDQCYDRGISVRSCCGPPNFLTIRGVIQAHCIDGKKLSQLYHIDFPTARDTGQRDACGCTKSKDIGRYDGPFMCPHDCDYCYASPRKI